MPIKFTLTAALSANLRPNSLKILSRWNIRSVLCLFTGSNACVAIAFTNSPHRKFSKKTFCRKVNAFHNIHRRTETAVFTAWKPETETESKIRKPISTIMHMYKNRKPNQISHVLGLVHGFMKTCVSGRFSLYHTSLINIIKYQCPLRNYLLYDTSLAVNPTPPPCTLMHVYALRRHLLSFTHPIHVRKGGIITCASFITSGKHYFIHFKAC